jgi:hypothetical protein
MVADPKALQYVLQSSGYNFPKRTDMLKVTEMVAGTAALACAHGPFLTWNHFLGHSQTVHGVCLRKSPRTPEKDFGPRFFRFSIKIVYPNISRSVVQGV